MTYFHQMLPRTLLSYFNSREAAKSGFPDWKCALSKMQKVLKIAVPVFVGGLSGLAVLALLIAGFSAGGAETNIAASASPSATPSATASSPEPSPSVSDGRTCSVAELAADPRLGNLQAAVVNLTTDELLFDRNAAVAAAQPR